jgi:signal transduction histidine kinase
MSHYFQLPLRQVIVLFLALLYFPLLSQQKNSNHSWTEVKTRGRGTITAYWYESRPFIYRTPKGMEGIEFEIMEGFKKYLKEFHHVDLQIVWKETKSFGDTFARIRDGEQEGTVGVSAFSITPERLKEVGFTEPYMADISVLITGKNIPIVQTTDEFNELFSKLTAIAIEGTTYEEDILRLKNDGNLPFRIDYIPSSQNILRSVEARDSAFAFIDLPVYLMMFNEDPSIKVKRQNLYPVKRKGYAIIHPQQSDWAAPLQAYFSSAGFASSLETIISHYIDSDLYHFVERLAIHSNDLVELLTKEKEIQYKDLIGKSNQIEQETRTRNFLILLIIVIVLFLIVIILLYRKRSEQKQEIELQRRSIELKNEQLEKRNHHLVTLDEEKNNLIKILAHDLRTPINHVQGLAQVFLLSNDALSEEQKMIIQRISDASVRLNKMISNILDIDSLENNRVKIFVEEIKVTPLIGQVVKSFDKQAGKKNIELSMVSGAENGRIKGDPLFLIQVFENLISNALKFSEKQEKVEVAIREKGDHLWICVKDSGPGLTEEDMELLFRKFQPLSAKPTDGENSIGLGLSIVKKYVELMGGKVWCESEPGMGANFIVEFRKVE